MEESGGTGEIPLFDRILMDFPRWVEQNSMLLWGVVGVCLLFLILYPYFDDFVVQWKQRQKDARRAKLKSFEVTEEVRLARARQQADFDKSVAEAREKRRRQAKSRDQDKKEQLDPDLDLRKLRSLRDKNEDQLDWGAPSRPSQSFSYRPSGSMRSMPRRRGR